MFIFSSICSPKQDTSGESLTSYMKISKMRVATGMGRKVRKRVRNQEEAYMEVWKL